MSGLRSLGFCYLASASVFLLAATMAAHPDLDRTLRVQAAALTRRVAALAHQQDLTFFDAPYVSARLDIAADDDGPRVSIAIDPEPQQKPQPQQMAAAPVQSLVLPDLSPLPAPALPDIAAPQAPDVTPPDFAIAQDDVAAPVAAPAATRQAMARLKDSLTPEMLAHFELFLFVSKADKGPLAQRMYVFRKDAAGELTLAYDWAASTGREKPEISAIGHHTVTTTPQGFYELDPSRMYRAYHSTSWDQAMPYAMFFNWERQGLQTGLAIHAASGDDIARLGNRASAGCVHLSPEHAALLYNLIRSHYRGSVPRFAYNARTATSSNSGDFARDAAGDLKMADGYKVLIDIEDYGGDNVVAALF